MIRFQQPFPQRNPVDEAMALLQQGKMAECLEACRKIEAGAPGQIQVAELTGIALLNLGDAAAALPLLARVAAVNKRVPHTHVNLAGAQVELGRFDEALAALDAGLAAVPGDPLIATMRLAINSGPYFPGTGFQGWHAPERQVYMSAAVWLQREGDGPLRILEVGSYMGASAITWGRAVAELTGRSATLTCVDAWEDAETSQYETVAAMAASLKSGSCERIFRRVTSFIPQRVDVKAVKAFSDKALRELQGPYGIIYIDACHLYEEARTDIELSKGLLADGGFICGDDLELQLHEVDVANARAMSRKDYVTDPRSGTSFHPGVTLAVGELLGEVSAYRGFWIMQKRGTAFDKVDMKGARGLLPRHWPEQRYADIRRNIAVDGFLDTLA
jgi:predicted O-methyltransferase YrrM